ncbi:MAG: leucine-rich repeat domain-containing protein [Candidatus Hermodarchaeota archaeon]
MIIVSLILFTILSIGVCTFIHSNHHPVKEFKVNEFLKLKLENGKTNIYVKNRVFRQCMYLLLNIPKDKIHKYDHIESIDEAAESLDRSMERDFRVRSQITPEEEFLGHCSNIQAWADNDYDTRILHRNLAFPLLKRLADIGDPLAMKRFKEEVAIRYASGYPSVMQYLTQRGYLNYLTSEEFESIINDIESPLITDISKKINLYLNQSDNANVIKEISYSIGGLLKTLKFKHSYLLLTRVLKEIPEEARQKFIEIICYNFQSSKSFPMLDFVKSIENHYNNIKLNYICYESKFIGFLTGNKLNLRQRGITEFEKVEGIRKNANEVEEIDLSKNHISKVKGFEEFLNLHTLKLNYNNIREINGLELCEKLRILELNNNQISSLDSLNKLKYLEKLSIRNNSIEEISEISSLKHLEFLDLSGNIGISKIPEMLKDHPSLKILKLSGCPLSKYTESTSKFFWMEANYSYYSNFSSKDILQYQHTFNKNALYGNRLYKHFVKWLLNIQSIKMKFKCGYKTINQYEIESNKSAIWNGKPTKAFITWLENKKQTRITDFL